MTSQPLPRFRLSQRKQLRLSEESLVNISTFGEALHLPLVVQPAVQSVSLSNWLVNQRDFLESRAPTNFKRLSPPFVEKRWLIKNGVLHGAR